MLQDKRFKNRELQIMKMLDNHVNVTTLHHFFYTEGEKAHAALATPPPPPPLAGASTPSFARAPRCRQMTRTSTW